jgi:predicted amidophosphoribosyltransferase
MRGIFGELFDCRPAAALSACAARPERGRPRVRRSPAPARASGPALRALRGARCPIRSRRRALRDCRRDPPRSSRTIALADYRAQPAIREWILALKHGASPISRGRSARRLGARLAEEGDALLVPVPLHPLRRLERATTRRCSSRAAAADAAPDAAGWRVLRALRRVRSTPAQGSSGAAALGERRRRVRSAGGGPLRRAPGSTEPGCGSSTTS